MSALRRRVSRRVVKSTFQECFEYGIPRPKNSVLKRPVSLPVSRPKRKVTDTPPKSKKLDQRSQSVHKAKTKLSKGIARKAVTRAAETLQKIEKDSVRKTRLRGKNNVSSEAETLMPEIKNSTYLKNISIKEEKDPVTQTESHVSTSRAVKSEAAFSSEEWQPVVKMEKLSVESKKRGVSTSSSKQTRTRKTRSGSSRNARKASMSDESLLLTSDSESGKESTSNISLEEVLEDISVSSSGEIEGNDTGFEELSKSKCSVLASPNTKSGINNLTNDSVLEDWPEDTSDSVDGPEEKFSSVNDCDDKSSLHSSLGHNWSTPHVTQLIHLQEHFHFITNDLRSSFENLKTIIEDKNTVIESFKSKLETYMGNEYHQMLESILRKHDFNDPKSPAREVLETLKKYAEM